MSHPGDYKTQAISVTAKWRALPEACDGHFLRNVRIRFQIQDPLNHRRWINIGGYVAPFDETITNDGGEASAYDPRTTTIPKPKLRERERYRCTPGKGVTHVRALLRNRVLAQGKGIVAETIRKAPVTVRRVSYVPSRLRHRGQLRGPC